MGKVKPLTSVGSTWASPNDFIETQEQASSIFRQLRRDAREGSQHNKPEWAKLRSLLHRLGAEI